MLKKDESFPIAARAERALDRRRFLGLAGCAALFVAAGEWLAARMGTALSVPLELVPGDAAGLATGQARAVTATDGREALMVRLATGDVVAFDRRCPHLGCPVIWSPEHQRFECPCHRAAFDARTGGVLFGPPRRGLEPATVGRAVRAETAATH